MEVLTPEAARETIEPQSTQTMTTTLWDLMATMHAAAEPGEEEFVTLAAVHLLGTSHARFVHSGKTLEIMDTDDHFHATNN